MKKKWVPCINEPYFCVDFYGDVVDFNLKESDHDD